MCKLYNIIRGIFLESCVLLLVEGVLYGLKIRLLACILNSSDIFANMAVSVWRMACHSGVSSRDGGTRWLSWVICFLSPCYNHHQKTIGFQGAYFDFLGDCGM